MNLHWADAVRLLHFKRDHHSWDDLILHLRELLHVTDHNVDSIPGPALNLSCGVHDLLDQEASIEALSVSIIEVDWSSGEIVVKLNVSLEDIVCFLLHCEKLLRGEESRLGSGWEVLVTPGRAVGISITVVLVLQERSTIRRVSLDLCLAMVRIIARRYK